jgi:hypothetical protein
MRKTLFGKLVGVLLAFLAVTSMTLLQVESSNAAVQAQTTRVKIILSQAQLAMLAKQDHALYAQVIKAYRTGAPLAVTQHDYRVLSHLSTAYLGNAKAGQTQVTIPRTVTAGPLGPVVDFLRNLYNDLNTGGPLASLPYAGVAALVVFVIEIIVIGVNTILTLPAAAAAASK